MLYPEHSQHEANTTFRSMMMGAFSALEAHTLERLMRRLDYALAKREELGLLDPPPMRLYDQERDNDPLE